MYCKKCGTYNSSESLICKKCKDNLVNQYLNDDNKKDSDKEDNLVNNTEAQVTNNKNNNKNQRRKKSKKKKFKKRKSLFKRNSKKNIKKKNEECDNNEGNNSNNLNSCITNLIILFLIFIIFILSIYILKLKITVVPDVVNLSIDDAIILLEDSDLNYNIITENVDHDEDNNIVLFQDRVADKYILKGSTITLTVGSIVDKENVNDEELVYLDDYIGMDSNVAIKLIEEIGLDYSVVMVNSSEENGIVINQNPSANEEVTKDTVIILYVSVNEEELDSDAELDDS